MPVTLDNLTALTDDAALAVAFRDHRTSMGDARAEIHEVITAISGEQSRRLGLWLHAQP